MRDRKKSKIVWIIAGICLIAIVGEALLLAGVFRKSNRTNGKKAGTTTPTVTEAVQKGGGLGLFYWEGAWITVGTKSWEENHRRGEKYGSGWASSYAGAYDPNDAGLYYGGSAWDNQAFFDASGRALDSLKVFALARSGGE